MPLNKQPLPLTPEPQSVKKARQWVSDVLERLGRNDLVDSAELGVSELVTNAILHADPPISVRVRGTRDHPRVEVHDRSQHPPEVNVDMADEEKLLSTIGRGLGIVALYSSTWGSDIRADGKTVWFEPASELRTDRDLSGNVFEFIRTADDGLAGAGEGEDEDEARREDWVTVRLLGMPVQLFAHFRQRYSELRRELRLLAVTHSEDYPVAKELSDLSVQIEQERQMASGAGQLDRAIAEGKVSTDLEYVVPPSTPESMTRLLEMLEKADEFCREQRLLVLAATPQQRELQRWYLTEFSRQAAGEPPMPWPGGYDVELPEL